jgi:molybdenum cofactor sulfurtransferase
MEDNHTSVLGMREVVAMNGAKVRCLSHEQTLHTFNSNKITSELSSNQESNSLFVYSAQCNFSGVKYPLSWIKKVHDGALENSDKR